MRAAALALVLAAAGCNDSSGPTLSIGSTRTAVRVLQTPAARADALVTWGDAEPYVPILLADPRERLWHLHTRGTRRGFDAVFLSAAGTIVEQQPLARLKEEGITSAKPAAYVLLLPEGGWKECGAAVGQSATLPPCRPQPMPVVTFEGKPDKLFVETALTEWERQRGLMYRRALDPDEGMVFKYPDRRELGFWMRNTKIPLDIAFFNADGRIVRIHAHMAIERDEPRYPSGQPVQYALEVNDGWFERHGIKEGDRVVLPKELLEARAHY
jgi:uncharacterized membrane protein (UPF0127 family)